MNIINLERGHGKTYHLITEAAKNNAYIVCRDKAEAERIFQIALDRELNINFPITFQEFINKWYHGMGIKEFMIDDVDILLYRLTSVPISLCTYTSN